MRQMILAHPQNKLENELVKIFHSSNLPSHFNKTGNKEFTNYQRISIIILFRRSGKSIRQFIDENLSESKWISWLGLKKIPRKSTLHDWLKLFSMKTIRQLCKLLIPKEVKLTAIDSTGIDSWRRSNHYEKRCNEIKKLPPMNYAKTSLFIDVENKIILDWDLVMSHEHDVKIAERIFKRNTLKNIFGLGDKGYDSENLHEISRANGINFFAPVRKMNKRAFKNQRPKGIYRRQCKENPPEFKGMRSIVENVNYVLKETQIASLRSKKHSMRERELGWHLIFYNIKKIIGLTKSNDVQTFLFFQIRIHGLSKKPSERFIKYTFLYFLEILRILKNCSKKMDAELKNSILKTGTTILGIVCKDGVVMAADRQVTMGHLVMRKNEFKVFPINDYLILSGCGIAGDIQRVPKILTAELKLKELKSRSRPTVKQAASLLNNMSYSGIRRPSMIPQQAGFLIAGFNEDSSVELYSIEPAGSISKIDDYDANMGSGMPYVLGLLERQYKKDMTLKEGIELAKEALKSSTQRDTGSGYGIDIFTITKDGIKKVVDQTIEPKYTDRE